MQLDSIGQHDRRRVLDMRVLIIEDSKPLAENLHDFLTTKGFTVDCAGDGLTGLHLAVSHRFDVIVLDLGLPGLDGLKVCRLLKEQAEKATRILMLTARDTLEEKLEGFAAGADDYLVKPFALRELEARLLALGRRDNPQSKLKVGDLVLDLKRRTAHRKGRSIELTPAMLKLLEALMRAPGRVLRRAELEYAIWADEPPDSDSLRSHIYTLRNAIDKPFETPMLRTVRGVGWVLEESSDP